MNPSDHVTIDILKRQSRRSITLHITPDGQVEVRAPRFTPSFVIQRFVDSKKDWIEKGKIESTKQKNHTRLYKEGAVFAIAGIDYTIHITGGNAIVLVGSRIFFPEKFLKSPQTPMQTWLRGFAKKLLSERLAYYAPKMGVTYKKVSIRDTSSRWGSCSSSGTISFSYRLILADLFIIDYVVVHELAHITHHNHKPVFWNRVARFYPDFRRARRWLKKEGHTLQI